MSSGGNLHPNLFQSKPKEDSELVFRGKAPLAISHVQTLTANTINLVYYVGLLNLWVLYWGIEAHASFNWNSLLDAFRQIHIFVSKSYLVKVLQTWKPVFVRC